MLSALRKFVLTSSTNSAAFNVSSVEFTNLVHLDFAGTLIKSNRIHGVLKRCTNIETFVVSVYERRKNQLYDIGLDRNGLNCIPLLKRLTSFRLFIDKHFRRPWLRFTIHDLCSVLKRLNLKEFHFVDIQSIFSVSLFDDSIISGLPMVQNLRLNASYLSPTLLFKLKKLEKLKVLRLFCNNYFRCVDRAWSSLCSFALLSLSSFPNLKVLNMQGLTCGMPTDLARFIAMKNLTELRLHGLLVNNDLLLAWHNANFYKQLTVLEIPFCVNVTDYGASFLASQSANFKSVNLNFSKITDATINVFAINAKRLERIYVTQDDHVIRVTPDGLLALLSARNAELKFIEIGYPLLTKLVAKPEFKRFKSTVQVVHNQKLPYVQDRIIG